MNMINACRVAVTPISDDIVTLVNRELAKRFTGARPLGARQFEKIA